MLAGNSWGRASVVVLRVGVLWVAAPHIEVVVADAPELEFLQATPALWAWPHVPGSGSGSGLLPSVLFQHSSPCWTLGEEHWRH